MLLVKTPLGRSANGARRWLNLGPLSFQPSELAKIAVIVCLSYMIVNMGRKIGTLKGFMMLAGSGGALALAAGDQVWMLENSVYSILSPEGFASILWKDSARAKEAAGVMQLTAADLYEKGIIEQVIPEPENLTSESLWQVTERLNDRIGEFLQKYASLSEEELLEHRYARFRKF